jgi:hypothetical protein
MRVLIKQWHLEIIIVIIVLSVKSIVRYEDRITNLMFNYQMCQMKSRDCIVQGEYT